MYKLLVKVENQVFGYERFMSFVFYNKNILFYFTIFTTTYNFLLLIPFKRLPIVDPCPYLHS